MKENPSKVQVPSRSLNRAVTSLGRERYFNITICLEPTSEKFPMKNVCNEMKIKDLKIFAEFSTGIPVNLQRLCYLDKGDLLESTDIQQNDIVAGAQLQLKVWHTWRELVEAAATNDVDKLFCLGVSSQSDYTSPNAEYMKSINPRLKREWLEERAFVALYIAAHRGYQQLVHKLIQGANVNARTPYGRSPLHVAAARGHGMIVDILLEKGADIDAEDENGETPLSIAAKFGNKVCERHLFLFRWQQRAKQTLKNKLQVDMFSHQYFDSTNPVWLKGPHGQIYFTQILPRGEFQGTSLSAPLSQGQQEDEGQAEGQGHTPDTKMEDLLESHTEKASGSLGTERSQERLPLVMEDRRKSRVPSASLLKTTSSYGSSRESIPARRTKSVGFSKADAKPAKAPASFDDWLNKKQTQDKRRTDKHKFERRRKQEAVDDHIYYYD